MNVKELIAELGKYDGDMKVSIIDKEGFLCEVNWVDMVDTKKTYLHIAGELEDQEKIIELGN